MDLFSKGILERAFSCSYEIEDDEMTGERLCV